MTNKNDYMLIDWNDWLNDTQGITLQEQGAYFMLVKMYWLNKGAIPDNMTKIFRSCGAISRSEKCAITSILQTYFLHINNHFYHKRIEEMLKKSNKIKEVRSKAAKSRWNLDDANAYTNADAKAYALPTYTNIYINNPTTTAHTREEKQTCSDFEIWELLGNEARQEAEHYTEGWDKSFLQKKYNEWLRKTKKGFPQNLNKAFPKWCVSFTKGKKPY